MPQHSAAPEATNNSSPFLFGFQNHHQWKFTGSSRTLDFRAIEAGGLSQISSSWIIAHQNRFRMGNHPNPLLVTLPTSWKNRCRGPTAQKVSLLQSAWSLYSCSTENDRWWEEFKHMLYRKITLTPWTILGGSPSDHYIVPSWRFIWRNCQGEVFWSEVVTKLWSRKSTCATYTNLEPQGQPFINGWLSMGWCTKSLYRKWSEITKHPFINGCLGFQEVPPMPLAGIHFWLRVSRRPNSWMDSS